MLGRRRSKFNRLDTRSLLSDRSDTRVGGVTNSSVGTNDNPIECSVSITLAEAFKGCTKKILFQKVKSCSNCVPPPSPSSSNCSSLVNKEPRSVNPCQECNGTGKTSNLEKRFASDCLKLKTQSCPSCKGTGFITCYVCRGTLTLKVRHTIQVQIAAGTMHMQTIIFPADMYGTSSNVLLTVSIRKHPKFSFRGRHLIVREQIQLTQALIGCSLLIKHVDNRILEFQPPPNTTISPGSIYKVSGEGMPGQQGKPPGDLFLVFSVAYPEKLLLTDEFLEEVKKHLSPRDAPSPQNLIADNEYELIPLDRAKIEELPSKFRRYFPAR